MSNQEFSDRLTKSFSRIGIGCVILKHFVNSCGRVKISFHRIDQLLNKPKILHPRHASGAILTQVKGFLKSHLVRDDFTRISLD